MTDAELDALMALKAAGTQGEWDARTFFKAEDHHTMKVTPQRGVYGSMSPEDARLAAAAVNALPALVAAARERDRLRSLLGRYAGHVSAIEGSNFLDEGFYVCPRTGWINEAEIAEIAALSLEAQKAGMPRAGQEESHD